MKCLLALLPLVILSSCATSGGGSSGNSGGKVTIPPIPAALDTTTVSSTIFVTGTFDGKGKAFKAGKSLGNGDQSEGQKPLFTLRPGATLKNVVLTSPAADGVHMEGASGTTTTISDCVWRDVGEDAITVSKGVKSSNFLVKNSGFFKAADKVVQVNAEGDVLLQNCWSDDFGRFARSNGTSNSDQKAYRITVDGGDFRKGDTVLKMSTPNAVGKVLKVAMENVKELFSASNGAKVSATK